MPLTTFGSLDPCAILGAPWAGGAGSGSAGEVHAFEARYLRALLVATRIQHDGGSVTAGTARRVMGHLLKRRGNRRGELPPLICAFTARPIDVTRALHSPGAP
jgi:hypothetical protein